MGKMLNHIEAHWNQIFKISRDSSKVSLLHHLKYKAYLYTVKQNDEDIKFLRNLNFQSVLVNDILMHLELKFIEREQCLEKK